MATNDYDKFIDADENRIAWVAVFERFDKIVRDLDQYAPLVADRFRQEFYEAARKPLAKPALGVDVCDAADAELSLVWPLSWKEAVDLGAELERNPYQVMQEHLLAMLEER